MNHFFMKFFKFFGVNPNMSLDLREEWVKTRLEELPADCKLLDAGAGTQRYKKYCAHLKYESQDFGEYDGKGDDQGIQVGEWDTSTIDIKSDITDIPRKDGTYDAVLCTEVLEHIPDPVAALRELSRLLKKDGVLIVTVPTRSLVHQAPYYFYAGFSRYFFEHYLPELGIEIERLDFSGNYFDDLMVEMIRNNYSMASKYSRNNFFWKIINAFFSFFSILILKHYSKKDKGSSEVDSFSIMIRGVKKG